MTAGLPVSPTVGHIVRTRFDVGLPSIPYWGCKGEDINVAHPSSIENSSRSVIQNRQILRLSAAIAAATGLFVSAQASAIESSLEAIDPSSGIAYSVTEDESITVRAALGSVGIRTTPPSGINTARIMADRGNPAACASLRETENRFPAEYSIEAAPEGTECNYRIVYWSGNWNWQGRDDITIAWAEEGGIGFEEADEPADDNNNQAGGGSPDGDTGSDTGHDDTDHGDTTTDTGSDSGDTTNDDGSNNPGSNGGDDTGMDHGGDDGSMDHGDDGSMDHGSDGSMDHGANHDAPRLIVTNGTNGSSDMVFGPREARSGHGVRIYCPVSHFAYDDPVIYPDQPGAAHLHMFWGNTQADAYLKGENIRNTSGTTCEGGTTNQSAMWTPALFNGNDEPVIPEEVIVYYKSFGVPGDRYDLLQVIPEGLEMLANDSTTGFNRWTRLGTDSFGPYFRLRMAFPSCVATDDGTRTGNPILKYRDMPGDARRIPNSHVAYPGGGASNLNEVGCPATHPYRFPTASFDLRYLATEVGNDAYLSSDRMAAPFSPNMSTLHGDYVAGFSEQAAADMLRCIQESRDCEFGGGRRQLPERFYSPDGEQLYRWSTRLEDYVDRTPYNGPQRTMYH